MKIIYLIALIILSVGNVFAQTESSEIKRSIQKLTKKVSLLERKIQNSGKPMILIKSPNPNLLKEVDALKHALSDSQKENSKLRKALKSELNGRLETFKRNDKTKFKNFEKVIYSNSEQNKKTTEKLNVKIETAEISTGKSIKDINNKAGRNTVNWVVTVLVVISSVILLFILIIKLIFKHKGDLACDLQNTKKSLEEEGLKLDNKLIEVLEVQLKILKNNSSGVKKEPDHSLALKVADEIIRIQKNLTRMDEKTKGLKQLIASVKRIQDNFSSNGYEIVNMLGSVFHDGMKVSANFIPDDNLEAGQQIITRIIKPQVNFGGIMIQSAQIEVSQG